MYEEEEEEEANRLPLVGFVATTGESIDYLGFPSRSRGVPPRLKWVH